MTRDTLSERVERLPREMERMVEARTRSAGQQQESGWAKTESVRDDPREGDERLGGGEEERGEKEPQRAGQQSEGLTSESGQRPEKPGRRHG